MSICWPVSSPEAASPKKLDNGITSIFHQLYLLGSVILVCISTPDVIVDMHLSLNGIFLSGLFMNSTF